MRAARRATRHDDRKLTGGQETILCIEDDGGLGQFPGLMA
jgi:hypothetical protein